MYVQIERKEDGRLLVRHGAFGTRHASVQRCFPWSEPQRFISLRDDEGEELVLVDHLENLDDRSRHAVEEALAEAGFVFEVRSIHAIETEFEIRDWHVNSDQGELRFQTRLDEWPRETRDGSLLLRDVAGNLIRFPQPDTLDRKSADLLWSYLD